MLKVLKVLLVVVGVMSSGAHAATTTRNVNCRSLPAASSRIVARLAAGTEVGIHRQQGSWALVDHEPFACWVSGQYLAYQSTAAANRASLSQVRAANRATKTTHWRTMRTRAASAAYGHSRQSLWHSRARRAPSYNSGGSCPCSGSNICVGPRGGRFCYTSGGNKRYGV